ARPASRAGVADRGRPGWVDAGHAVPEWLRPRGPDPQRVARAARWPPTVAKGSARDLLRAAGVCQRGFLAGPDDRRPVRLAGRALCAERPAEADVAATARRSRPESPSGGRPACVSGGEDPARR